MCSIRQQLWAGIGRRADSSHVWAILWLSVSPPQPLHAVCRARWVEAQQSDPVAARLLGWMRGVGWGPCRTNRIGVRPFVASFLPRVSITQMRCHARDGPCAEPAQQSICFLWSPRHPPPGLAGTSPTKEQIARRLWCPPVAHDPTEHRCAGHLAQCPVEEQHACFISNRCGVPGVIFVASINR